MRPAQASSGALLSRNHSLDFWLGSQPLVLELGGPSGCSWQELRHMAQMGSGGGDIFLLLDFSKTCLGMVTEDRYWGVETPRTQPLVFLEAPRNQSRGGWPNCHCSLDKRREGGRMKPFYAQGGPLTILSSVFLATHPPSGKDLRTLPLIPAMVAAPFLSHRGCGRTYCPCCWISAAIGQLQAF